VISVAQTFDCYRKNQNVLFASGPLHVRHAVLQSNRFGVVKIAYEMMPHHCSLWVFALVVHKHSLKHVLANRALIVRPPIARVAQQLIFNGIHQPRAEV
jgi:hypothetical protein